jgi:drug/metabolite transporter (DMT)-like permease
MLRASNVSGAIMFANRRLLGIAALLFAASAWGAMFIASKNVLAHVDPFWFTLIRFMIASTLLVVLILPRGLAPWRSLRANAGPLALRGVSGFGIFSITLLTGLAHTEPSHGAVIMATMPITTQLMRWALDGVPPARTTLLTTTLALVGVAVVAGVLTHPSFAAKSTLPGDALILLSTLAWVWYTRGAAQFAQLEIVEYTTLTVVAALPLLVLATAFATTFEFASVPSAEDLHASWLAIAYVAVFGSAVAILAFNFGVRTLGAVTGTAFLNFVPISALTIATLLGKAPTTHELVGAAMVIGALLFHTLTTLRATSAAPAPEAVRGAMHPAAPPRRLAPIYSSTTRGK